MSDLVEFLRARLDEDERTARASSPWPWEENAECDEVLSARLPDDDGLVEDDLRVAEGHALSNNQLRANVRHIARHDPARVLAEVAAKRAILDLAAAAETHLQDYRKHVAEYSVVRQAETPRNALLMAVQRLAQVYAQHADYREEWAP